MTHAILTIAAGLALAFIAAILRERRRQKAAKRRSARNLALAINRLSQRNSDHMVYRPTYGYGNYKKAP